MFAHRITQFIGPDGEIGKRCGLRSRWSKILESSTLSSGTGIKRVLVIGLVFL